MLNGSKIAGRVTVQFPAYIRSLLINVKIIQMPRLPQGLAIVLIMHGEKLPAQVFRRVNGDYLMHV